MPSSRRRLPHWYEDGKWLFVTWHLQGCLPDALYPPAHKTSDGHAFAWMDRYLDLVREGPKYLLIDRIAQIVATALVRGAELGHYELGAWVIMANHVHALLLPRIAPNRLLQSLKGLTARRANRVLGRTGQVFWQAESYDHWVRDAEELARISRYIEENPVRAGLVACAEDYRWSSAGADKSVGAAGLGACTPR